METFKEKYVINFCEQCNCGYIPIDSKKTLDDIYIFLITPTTETICENHIDSIYYLYIGLYFEQNLCYDEMKKYYGIAVNMGNVYPMSTLGVYYQRKEKNYELMEHYLQMAIENGDNNALCHYGEYFYKIQNYRKMKEYYYMAYNSGIMIAAVILGDYYYAVEKNYEKMRQCYLMALNGKITARELAVLNSKTLIFNKNIIHL